jgi:hypothetical protein
MGKPYANTMSGLLKKRGELMGQAQTLRESLASVGNDIEALDRTLIALGYDGDLKAVESENLKERIPRHECWPEAVRLGATHVLAHTTPAGEQVRCAEEQDLIALWNPPLNVQHRTTG